MKIQHICIIGAGISGLVAAKTFIEEGYTVTIFEKQNKVGGVWEKSRTYLGLTTQNPRDTYAFSDYPMPASYLEWPTAEQMRKYLESYAENFGILEKIRFQTEVVHLERKPNIQPKWLVTVNFQDDSNGEIKQQKYEFDFVLICNGIFNIPKIPLLPGKEEFIASGGQVLHSTEFNDSCQINDKRVIVVGFGKSATDIAAYAVRQAKECTLVFRKTLWKVPRFFLGLVNIKYLLLIRFIEAWLPYRQLRGIEWILHTIGKPLVWVFWQILEIFLRLQFRLDACGMLPDKSMYKSADCSIALAPEGFYENVYSGKLQTRKTTVTGFCKDGVELANGERLQADIIIFGTGFRQDVPFLEEKYRQILIDDQGYFHLYRNLIHPDIPEIGFVGYNTGLFSQLTSEIGAWWLAEYVKGNLVLPSRAEMIEDIKTEFHWKQTNSPGNTVSGTCVSPFNFHHLEQLMQDMGVSSHGKGWQRIAEVVMPVNPSAYKSIRQELQKNKPVNRLIA